MSDLKNKELTHAEQLIEKGKFEEALQVIINYEKKGGLTNFDLLSCHLLKGSVLNMLGRFREVLTLAKLAYQESQKLGKNLQTVDSLILKGRASWLLGRADDALDAINQGETLLKTLNYESPLEITQRECWIAFVKGVVYADKGDSDQNLKYLKQSLSLGEELRDKQLIFYCLTLIGAHFTFKGDLNSALTYANCAQETAGEIHNKQIVAYNYINLGNVSSLKGELDRALDYYENGLELFKKINNRLFIAICLINIGDIYLKKGDLDQSKEVLEQALMLEEKIGNIQEICYVLDVLIWVTLEKRDFKQAEQYFLRLKEYNDRNENKIINLIYRLNKALILRSDHQTCDPIKAKELLKQIVEEEGIRIEFTVYALMYLCELLLTNLRETNNLKIIDEIQTYIARILEFATNLHSYWLLSETYLLHAKLELLTLDLNEAQRSLTKAHHIAKQYGLDQLVLRISSERDELLEQFSKWENSRRSRLKIAEFMNLARVDEQIVRMLRNRLDLKKIAF